MSLEQKLLDLGAETVCGDLLLNRVKVGMYRDGAFIPMPEALDIVTKADEAASGAVEVVEAPVVRPAARPAGRKPKPQPVETPVVEEVAATPAETPAIEDPLANLDDLLGPQ